MAQESYFFMAVRECSIDIGIAINKNHISLQDESSGYLQSTPQNHKDVIYLTRYEGNLGLGNTAQGDGIKFRGRGMKQLTGRYNYSQYWIYRGWMLKSSFDANWFKNGKQGPAIPNPEILADNHFNAVDSAGFYFSFRSIARLCDAGFSEKTSDNVSHAVNPGEKPPHKNRWKFAQSTFKYLEDAK